MHHDASLNIRQLQVFEAVARLESYSRAQQELGISVSAISNAMSQLEGQLGFTLCQRGRGGFSLTEKGQQFLQQAIRVLSELNELERQSAFPGPVGRIPPQALSADGSALDEARCFRRPTFWECAGEQPRESASPAPPHPSPLPEERGQSVPADTLVSAGTERFPLPLGEG